MNDFGISSENLLRVLPTVLAEDASMRALASAIADVLASRPAEISKILIYPKIRSLPEPLLDILAVDFKVDWWDADYSLAQKRSILFDSFYIHRILGTPAAVERAISVIYPRTTVKEWFTYSGIPYHFILSIDVTYDNVDPVRHRRVLDRVNYYKNLRSWLDGIEYVAVPDGFAEIYAGVAPAGLSLSYTVEVPVYGI